MVAFSGMNGTFIELQLVWFSALGELTVQFNKNPSSNPVSVHRGYVSLQDNLLTFEGFMLVLSLWASSLEN